MPTKRGEGLLLNRGAKEQGFHARFILLTSQTRMDGRAPVCLQLSHNRKVKRYFTKEYCAPAQWDADTCRMKPRTKGSPQVNAMLNAMETRVVGIVDALVVNKALSLDNFDKRYRNPKATEEVAAYMLDLAATYKANRQDGTAACFRDAVGALDRFTGGKPITFAALTAAKLEELERYLRDEGCTNGGIGVYMRMIRIAMNRAIKSGLMDKGQYPFDTVQTPGYSMKRLKSVFRPRALSEADLNKVKAFPFEDHPALGDTVRLFLFSYYARGMNFRDMALLRPGNFTEGRMRYTRMKTKARGAAANFDIPVLPQMAEIIDHFRDAGSPWTFPILRRHHREDDSDAIWSRTKDALRLANRHLKQVARLLDIEGDFTFYVARHSYAMNRKRNGISTGLLSESMGHASEAITHAYLKSFSNEELDAANKGL